MTPVVVEFREVSGKGLGRVKFSDTGVTGPAALVAVCHVFVRKMGPKSAAAIFSDWSNGSVLSRKVT